MHGFRHPCSSGVPCHSSSLHQCQGRAGLSTAALCCLADCRRQAVCRGAPKTTHTGNLRHSCLDVLVIYQVQQNGKVWAIIIHVLMKFMFLTLPCQIILDNRMCFECLHTCSTTVGLVEEDEKCRTVTPGLALQLSVLYHGATYVALDTRHSKSNQMYDFPDLELTLMLLNCCLPRI